MPETNGAAQQLAAPEEIPVPAQRLKIHTLFCMLLLCSLDLYNILHMFFLTLFSIFHQKLEQLCHFWKNNLAANFCPSSFSLRPQAPGSRCFPTVTDPPQQGSSATWAVCQRHQKPVKQRRVGARGKRIHGFQMGDSEQHYTDNSVREAPAQSCSLHRNSEQREKPARYPASSTCSTFFLFKGETKARCV